MNRYMRECRKKRGYEAPDVQLHMFVMEAGFAGPTWLKGDSDGKGAAEQSSPIGQYQDGVNWTNDTWN